MLTKMIHMYLRYLFQKYPAFILPIIALLCIFSACASTKTENFLKALPKKEGTLYFIKPIPFKTSNQSSFTPDFTLNYQTDTQHIVKMNYFIDYHSPIEKLDSVVFISNLSGVSQPILGIHQAKQMFIEKSNNKTWQHRFTSDIPLKDFMNLLGPQNYVEGIIYISNQENIPFQSTSKWKKMHQAVYQTLRIETSQ